MSRPDLISAMQHIDPELIEEAMQKPPIRKRSALSGWISAAACLCLVLGSLWLLRRQAPEPHEDSIAASSDFANELAPQAFDTVQTLFFEGAEYYICGSGESAILEDCGLPAQLSEALAGRHLCYLEEESENHYIPVPNTLDRVLFDPAATESSLPICQAPVYRFEGSSDVQLPDIALYEYAPSPNQNVFILCIDGSYYAAIRHDAEGYHGIEKEESP